MEHIRETVASLMARARAHFFVKSGAVPRHEPIAALRDFHSDIRQYLVEPEFFTSTAQLRQHARANYFGCHPDILGFAGLLCEELRKRNFPVYVHTAYRSPELQARLKREGKSQLASGAHQRGAAVDIVHSLHHWDLSPHAWRYIGLVGEHIIRTRALAVRWGGRWSFYDPAHWELKQWRSLSEVYPYDLSTGEVFPPVNYTPAALKKRFA